MFSFWWAGWEFQSHAGSIEGLDRSGHGLAGSEFQSHAGSIEGDSVSDAGSNSYQGFNPTLVRLRAGPARWHPGASPEFQSHAGSIEGWRFSKP
ncbi:MAG: hypothetical protein NZ572_08295 [Thermoflexus sp.]|nr:hypothetical protein [Thermoflexus sp.]